MAGKAREETEVKVGTFLTKIESTATKLLNRAKYAKDEAGNRVKTAEGKSTTVPFDYWHIVDTTISTVKDLHRSVDALINDAGLSIETVVADLNYGLEYRGRDALAQGVDANVTAKQRKAIDRIRGLMEDGIADIEVASAMLARSGLTPEQVAQYLAE